MPFRPDKQHGPTVSDHMEEKRHWEGYWDRRHEKLKKSGTEEKVYGNLVKTKKKKKRKSGKIFKHCNIYFNGRSKDFSAMHWQRAIRLHGGDVSMLLNSTVTHVICSNLSGGKTKRATKR